MRDNHRWENKEERKAASEEFKVVMSQEFNVMYGTEVDDITSWQVMCGVLGINPIPQDLGACQDVSTTVRTFARAIPLTRDEFAGCPLGTR